MDAKPYLQLLADRLVADLSANGELTKFTCNPDLIGAFAEATVRQLVRRFVAPLHVSHGSIIYEGNCRTGKKSDVPEIDTIIWSPCPLPPIFESGDFALVPRGSALAVLEIKRSNYKDAARRMRGLFDRENELLHWPNEPRRTANMQGRVLGVVCLRKYAKDSHLDRLLNENRAVQLFRKSTKGDYEPCPKSVFRLVNFLMGARLRASQLDGTIRIPDTFFTE